MMVTCLYQTAHRARSSLSTATATPIPQTPRLPSEASDNSATPSPACSPTRHAAPAPETTTSSTSIVSSPVRPRRGVWSPQSVATAGAGRPNRLPCSWSHSHRRGRQHSSSRGRCVTDSSAATRAAACTSIARATRRDGGARWKAVATGRRFAVTVREVGGDSRLPTSYFRSRLLRCLDTSPS